VGAEVADQVTIPAVQPVPAAPVVQAVIPPPTGGP
jgi:hypothetical protein